MVTRGEGEREMDEMVKGDMVNNSVINLYSDK